MDSVSVMKCDSYENKKIHSVLIKSLENINFSFKKKMRVLIKPNLLSPNTPESAITTHPVILEELCKILKENNCDIMIGDSSGYNTKESLEVCGVNRLSKYATILNFDELEKQEVLLDNGRKIFLPRILFNVDLIINVAKLKTHVLTRTTLCVKNLYGCIPGNIKSYYHKILPNPFDFSELLVSLCNKIKPGLNIIDGVVGLEGDGPGSSGNPVNSGLIFAGKNPYAVDFIASKMIGFNPQKVYVNKIAKTNKKNILVIGNAKDFILNFKKPKNLGFVSSFLKIFPPPKISFDYDKCKKCHLCEQKCPQKAIILNPYPVCDHKKCIRCFCCIEVCPYDAVYLEDLWIKKFLKSLYKKFSKKSLKKKIEKV